VRKGNRSSSRGDFIGQDYVHEEDDKEMEVVVVVHLNSTLRTARWSKMESINARINIIQSM
jgi:hypothetical protein